VQEINLYEHLKCPDCKSKLEMRRQLICTHCGRVFPIGNDRIIDLLPTSLSAPDIAEEHFWATDAREGVKSHPLLSLVHKGDVLLQFYEQVLPKLNLQGTALEIGSGTCWLSSLIKLKFPAIYAIATDVSYSALIKGIQVSEFLHARIDRFVTCKVEQLPFENDFFDHVIGSAVLHHTNPERAIPEIYRILKNQGSYVGVWELAIPRILGIFWGSKFGLAGRAEREIGSK
jgi:SAM-dependent methyltransferase